MAGPAGRVSVVRRRPDVTVTPASHAELPSHPARPGPERVAPSPTDAAAVASGNATGTGHRRSCPSRRRLPLRHSSRRLLRPGQEEVPRRACHIGAAVGHGLADRAVRVRVQGPSSSRGKRGWHTAAAKPAREGKRREADAWRTVCWHGRPGQDTERWRAHFFPFLFFKRPAAKSKHCLACIVCPDEFRRNRMLTVVDLE